jgi:hypothetical protein
MNNALKFTIHYNLNTANRNLQNPQRSILKSHQTPNFNQQPHVAFISLNNPPHHPPSFFDRRWFCLPQKDAPPPYDKVKEQYTSCVSNTLLVTLCAICVASFFVELAHHTSHITHHTSHITHHTSHITHHTSHITHHTSHLSIRNSRPNVFLRRLTPILR